MNASPKLHSDQQMKERNYLWMYLKEVELTFACFYWSDYDASHGGERNQLKKQFRVFNASSSFTTLLSVRKVLEFFTKEEPKRKHRTASDIKASAFGFQKMRNRAETREMVDEIGQHVAHLTMPGLELQRRGMPITGLVHEAHNQSLEFFDFIESKYLDLSFLADRQMLARIEELREEIKALTSKILKA